MSATHTVSPETIAYLDQHDRMAEQQGTAAICRAVNALTEHEADSRNAGGWCMVAVWSGPNGSLYVASEEGDLYVHHYASEEAWLEGEDVEPMTTRAFTSRKRFKAWLKAQAAAEAADAAEDAALDAFLASLPYGPERIATRTAWHAACAVNADAARKFQTVDDLSRGLY